MTLWCNQCRQRVGGRRGLFVVQILSLLPVTLCRKCMQRFGAMFLTIPQAYDDDVSAFEIAAASQ